MIPAVPNCPDDTKRMCIQSLSVSQIASFLFAFILSIQGISVTYEDTHWVSWLINSAILFAIFYYFLSSWFVEEKLITPLRRLGSYLSWAEWLLRLGGFALLLCVTLKMASQNSTKLCPISFILFIMFFVYLTWDLLLHIASKKSTDEDKKILKPEIGKFAITDICGLLGTIILLSISRMISTSNGNLATNTAITIGFLAALSITCFLLPVIIYPEVRDLIKQTFNRLKHRQTLR